MTDEQLHIIIELALSRRNELLNDYVKSNKKLQEATEALITDLEYIEIHCKNELKHLTKTNHPCRSLFEFDAEQP